MHKGFQTLKAIQQLDLNRFLLLFAVVLYVFSTEIANYNTTINEAWIRWKYILMFDLILVVFSLRNEVKKLVSNFGFKIIISILINYFIDEYFNLEGWSWNDFLTILFIIIESIFTKNERR